MKINMNMIMKMRMDLLVAILVAFLTSRLRGSHPYDDDEDGDDDGDEDEPLRRTCWSVGIRSGGVRQLVVIVATRAIQRADVQSLTRRGS